MKRWVLTTAICMIFICVGVITTYSVLGEPESGTAYLRAGSLELELFRTELDCRVPDSEGYLRTVSSSEETDLSDRYAGPLFGEAESAMLVPGSYLGATLELRNRGSVAVVYRIEAKMTAEATALAEQLTVSLRSENGTVITHSLADLTDGAILLEGLISAGEEAQSFVIRIEFEDRSDNNAAMGAYAGLDFIVTATQATAGE